MNAALSTVGGAASLGKLGALSKPTLGGLAAYGTFSDGQDIGAAITGTDMQGNSLDAMERLKLGGMGLLGAVDLAGPGGRYPLTPESHGGVGGRLQETTNAGGGKVKPDAFEGIPNKLSETTTPDRAKHKYDLAVTAPEKELLNNTAPKRGNELTSQELNAEREIARRSQRKPSNDAGYVEEIELPNGHELRKRKDGIWCRFSNDPNCGPEFDPEQSTPSPNPQKKGGKRTTDPRIIGELPPGQERTSEELKKARKYYENHKQKAMKRWEKRTGKTWPPDPATGLDARASHPRALTDGGDSMFVEPAFGDSNTEHRVVNKETGETAHQRFGRKQGSTPRGGKREPTTDPRIIGELPAGEARTTAELKKAREYFRNHIDEAKKRWETRTGETWPPDPATGLDARASHPRALADGGDPMFVEPGFGDSNTEHRVPNPETGKTDQERFGARRRSKKKLE